MRLGIITDIHSNVVALRAVLKEFEERKIDKIICCGDMIGIGPYPEETIQELIKIPDKLIAVRGNHEQYLINGLPQKVHNDRRRMSLEEIQNHEWTHSKLSDSSRMFIENLSLHEDYIVENIRIHIIHYPMNNKGEYKRHIKTPTNNEIQELFLDINGDIFLYGHTHTASEILTENKWYINPGSLGCPMTSDYANCGVLTIENNKINYEHVTISYDVQEVIKEIESKKYPAYKGMIDIFFGGRYTEN